MTQFNPLKIYKQPVKIGDLRASKPQRPARFNESFHHFRYIIIIMGGLAMGTMFFVRLTITVAMISMVNHTAIFLHEHLNATEADRKEFFPEGYVETGEFKWTNEIQQIIISGYMLAYTIPQFFTTRWVMRYGLRIGVSISLLLCTLSIFLTPFLSYFGWKFTFALRLLNGLGGSAIIPSMMTVIELWLPPKDSLKGVVLLQFTSTLLYALAPLISGELAAIHWKLAFHVPALISLVVCVLWYLIVPDHPALSKLLSQKELDLINGIEEDELGESNGEQKDRIRSNQKPNLPWYFMYKIKVFYPLVLIWSLYNASLHGFLFLMPMYLSRVLKVPVSEVGVLSFYVQIGTIFCMLWPHPAADLFQRLFNVSLSTARSIVVFICVTAVCSTFSYLAFFHDDLIITISINRFFHLTGDNIVMATVMSMFGHAGVSGLVFSMMNSIGNMTPLIFCWVAGKFLDYTGETLECWSWIMAVMVVMNFMYFLIYSAFCPSERVDISVPEKKSIGIEQP